MDVWVAPQHNGLSVCLCLFYHLSLIDSLFHQSVPIFGSMTNMLFNDSTPQRDRQTDRHIDGRTDGREG